VLLWIVRALLIGQSQPLDFLALLLGYIVIYVIEFVVDIRQLDRLVPDMRRELVHGHDIPIRRVLAEEKTGARAHRRYGDPFPDTIPRRLQLGHFHLSVTKWTEQIYKYRRVSEKEREQAGKEHDTANLRAFGLLGAREAIHREAEETDEKAENDYDHRTNPRR
jgi:hypothetical protein